MFLPSQLSVHGMSAANSLSSKEAFCFESETKNAIYVGETSSKSDFLWLCWLTSNIFMAHYQFQSLGVHWSANNEPVMGTNNHSLVSVSWHLGVSCGIFLLSDQEYALLFGLWFAFKSLRNKVSWEGACMVCLVGKRSGDRRSQVSVLVLPVSGCMTVASPFPSLGPALTAVKWTHWKHMFHVAFTRCG